MASIDDVAQRWVNRMVGKTKRGPISGTNVHDYGSDQIYSYGSHFEIARMIRTRSGKPSHWLLNGDRFSTSTDRHQATVRGWINRTGLPSVIIPHTALWSAGIADRDSVQIIDVTADQVIKMDHYADDLEGEWQYAMETEPRAWQNSKTGEVWVELRFGDRPPWPERCDQCRDDTPFDTDWDKYQQARLDREVHIRLRHGVWEALPTRVRNTGRRLHLRSGTGYWSAIDNPDHPRGYTFYRSSYRHVLGASLIRAKVETDGRPRTALFLSGFDENERMPSYFFCELPPKARPKTVAEAYEALKPGVVKLAEDLGREVKRQGDIFAVPLDSVTLRELKRQGGRLTKRGQLLHTNHVATDVVQVGEQMYARGTLRHVPESRRPDHKMVSLGKQWHLIVKNTVPIAA